MRDPRNHTLRGRVGRDTAGDDDAPERVSGVSDRAVRAGWDGVVDEFLVHVPRVDADVREGGAGDRAGERGVAGLRAALGKGGVGCVVRADAVEGVPRREGKRFLEGRGAVCGRREPE